MRPTAVVRRYQGKSGLVEEPLGEFFDVKIGGIKIMVRNGAVEINADYRLIVQPVSGNVITVRNVAHDGKLK